MERKILLFNYFLSKAVQQEQMLLKIKDEKSSRLALILAQTSIFRRYAQGCTTESIVLANPLFAEEMFLLVCLKAEEQGNRLMSAFDFGPVSKFVCGNLVYYLEDQDLTNYLAKTLYPQSRADKETYSRLLKKRWEEIEEIVLKAPAEHVRSASTTKLFMPTPCAETEMIDKSWQQLINDADFLSCFDLTKKYDLYGLSAPFILCEKRYSSWLKSA